jgi:hypothetical protein
MVTFREKILHKCISRELLHETGCSNPEMMLNLMESSGIKVKNVCVRMNVADKCRLEAVGEVLDMSLQEFVTAAIDEAITEALGVVKDRNMSDWFDQVLTEKLANEQIRMVPIPDDPSNFRLEIYEEPK